MQPAASALTLAALNTGKSIAARMAIIAITTRSSIRVKPWGVLDDTTLCFRPAEGLKIVFSLRINYLVLEPEKLLVPGNGIGHHVLAVDNGGSREICGPRHRRIQVGGGFQIKARDIRLP